LNLKSTKNGAWKTLYLFFGGIPVFINPGNSAFEHHIPLSLCHGGGKVVIFIMPERRPPKGGWLF
jgi:hypothetical protein